MKPGRRNPHIVDKRLPGQPASPLSVVCPRCQAPVGWKCRHHTRYAWRSLKHVHAERKRALLAWPDC